MDKKISFLNLLRIASEMVDRGILQRDPHNSNHILVYDFGKERPHSVNLHAAMVQIFHSENDELKELLETAKANGIDIGRYINPCQGCRYYNACGEDDRMEPCEGRETAVDIF